jgi:hypothetical protein
MKRSVWFEENGGEYSGCLRIECKSLKQIDSRTIKVNGAIIQIDEDIIVIDKPLKPDQSKVKGGR